MSEPQPTQMFLDMRGQFLRANPSDFGIKPTSALPRVWGALVDIGLPNGVASLLSVADGTTSLYTSSGGGIIGGGFHAPVREASERFLALLEGALGQFERRETFELPAAGRVAFVVRTYDASLGVDVAQADFDRGKHPLMPAFAAADKVLTALRLSEESAARSGDAREWRKKL